MNSVVEQGHRRLVQAPVPAIDADGLVVVAIGTALFAVASVLCLIMSDWLARTGHQEWTAISISGFGLGLIGLLYCWNRRRQRRT